MDLPSRKPRECLTGPRAAAAFGIIWRILSGTLLPRHGTTALGQKRPKLPWLPAAKSTTEQRVKFVPESDCRDINVVKDRAVNPEWICADLFDHLVGARTAARALLGLEVDHQLGLRRLLNGQVRPSLLDQFGAKTPVFGVGY